ncbi:MAG TPA: hypothetical protein VGD98_08125 [Ktedonobacteraceae bacterium]
MSQQFPLPDRSLSGGKSNSGDIAVNAPVAGNVVLIGHNNRAVFQLKIRGVQDATIRLNPQDPLFQRLTQMVADWSAQSHQLTSGGFSPTIAAPCLRAEDLQPGAPFSPPLGIPAPLAAGADQLARNFASLYEFLGQLDQQFGGTLVDLNDGQQGLNMSVLLLQKGNQALWRFRQGALRLFAEQASLYALAEPQNPTQPMLGTFQAAARANLDVLRGWVLYRKYRTSQGTLIDQTVFTGLSQGRWQAVLEGWRSGQRLSQEQVQAEWSYLQAIGDRYDPQAVQAAAREAEWYFREALRRQPEQSAALVNLAALLSESALLTYIETGTADRARLQQARTFFQQAHAFLDQRSDQDGRAALAQCLLYEAISLPPEARLEIVQWAANQAQQLRVALGPSAPGSVRWDIAQRNLARRDPGFVDWKKIEQARDILVGAGSLAVLVTTSQQLLGLHAPLTQVASAGLGSQPAPGQLAHPGGSAGGSMHPSAGQPSMPHALHQMPAHGVASHGSAVAARAASHGVVHGLRHLLSTVAGKIVAVAVVTTVVAASVAGVALAHRSSASSTYSTTQPGVICDKNGGVWNAQNLDGINCPTTAGTQLIINVGGSRGYLDLQQLPHNQAFSSNNTLTVTGVLGGIASGYQTKCIGLAERDANGGYSAEYCNNGAWFIASLSSGGTILNKLEKGVVTMLTTVTISLALNGTTLSFSVENNAISTASISTLQPTKVAIVYDCVGYGANQTINGNYLLVQDFSYKTAA